jgi:hypothetical protein
MADLALADQFAKSADRLLDRRAGVDAVLVVEVDVVGAETPERALQPDAQALGAAVGRARAALPVGDQAELGGQHDVVSPPGDRPADQLLVGVGAVDLGRVDQRDAQLEGAVDGPDRLLLVGAGAGVEGRHAHRAQPDARYVEVGE